MRYPGCRSPQPCVHKVHCLRMVQRMGDCPVIGADSHKRPQGNPGESNSAGAVQRFLEPGDCLAVVRACFVDRVQEDVRVYQHSQRACGPSRYSSASATLQTSIMSPRFAVVCTNGSHSGATRAFRIRTLTAAEAPTPASRLNASTAA